MAEANDVAEDAGPLLQATSVRPLRWTKNWIFATVMLCCYGFFKEFKPSEPFLTPYLTSNIKNFTKHEVTAKAFKFLCRTIHVTATDYLRLVSAIRPAYGSPYITRSRPLYTSYTRWHATFFLLSIDYPIHI